MKKITNRSTPTREQLRFFRCLSTSLLPAKLVAKRVGGRVNSGVMRGKENSTMKIIGTLGPKGTFSDIATNKYVKTLDYGCEVKYFKSIKSTLRSIGESCDCGILPIENFSEGFVTLVLDHIVDAELYIIGEIFLPIQFSFVSHANNISEVKKLFVQFVAKNQCSEFIESLNNVETVTTESNITSLESVIKKGATGSGAIVPSNSYHPNDFSFIIENVNDYENNQTRFLVFSKSQDLRCERNNLAYKTSIIVLNDDDHPGLLERILSPLSKRQINLTSITSRPTRKKFGRYNFFMGFEGHVTDTKVADALREIEACHRLKVLGSYPKANV